MSSGREFKADFVFIGIGHRSNVELVEQVDDAALADGQFLDERFSGAVIESPLSAGPELLRHRRLLFYTRVGNHSRCATRRRKMCHEVCHLRTGIADSSIICNIKGLNLEPYKRTEAP